MSAKRSRRGAKSNAKKEVSDKSPVKNVIEEKKTETSTEKRSGFFARREKSNSVVLICPMCDKKGAYPPGPRSCMNCNVMLMTEGEHKAWKKKVK